MWHVGADGECTWADFARAIFEEAGLDCRVIPITTAEYWAARAAAGLLGAAQRATGAPRLPHWREGLARVPGRHQARVGGRRIGALDQRQAVSETGARSLSGSHQARFARYHSTVSRRPCSQPICGFQPSSRRIFDESSR